MSIAPSPVKTPCIKVCIVDGESGLCMGCYRKLNAERKAIMAVLPDRRSLIRPEKLAMF